MRLSLLVKRLFAIAMLGVANAEAITNDVTLNVEVLGNPFTNYTQYMRNIWSLRAWSGLLYIGYGNANNTGPDPYSGGLNLIVLNPTNNTFSNQGSISEQQIDHFRTLTNQLIMPGFNPDELGGTGGTNGDFFIQKSGTTWTRIVTVPEATHNFDMYYFSNTLFAALGSYYPTIVSSVNNGTNWSSAISPTILNNSGYRVFSLFALSNVLYSMTGEIQTDGNITPCLLQYYPSNKQFAAQGSINSNYFTNFCPNSGYNIALNHIIARTTNIGPNLVYILGEIPNDINWDYPKGIFWCTNVNYGKKVNLAPGIQPWDIKPNATNGNVVWVLESSPLDTSGTNFLVQVNATTDFSNWTQVLQFTNESFARSFEMLDGDMYFGMGCTTNLLGTDVGNILRVRSQYFSTMLTPTVIWTNPVSIADGTALSAVQLNAKANVAGTFTYTPNLGVVLSPGTNTLTAVFTPTDKVDYSSVTDSVSIVVGLSTLLSLAVTPTTASVAAGSTQQFTATGTYPGGITQNLTSLVVWSSSNPTNATITGAGLAKGVAAGGSTITATLLGISGSSTLTVTPAALVSVAVTPASASVAAGLTQPFSATGTYTDGSTKSLTASATWNSRTTNASINSAGLAKGVVAGSSIITATLQGISGASTLTVTPAALVSVTATPASASVTAGLSQQFLATGTYTDGSTKSLTASSAWSSSSATNATINSAGLAKGVAAGTSTITATASGVSGASTLTVTPPTLVSVAVTPATASVAAGLTQQYTAIGTYTDGSTKSLTASATWSSSTTNATINSAGLAKGAAIGSSTITATFSGISGSGTLTVTSPTLVSVAVTPATASVAAGLTQQFTAAGSYTDGSTKSLTASASWSSSTTNATITSAGLAKGAAIGSSTITATFSGISGSGTLTVTSPTLVSVAVTPATASVAAGVTQQYTATGTYTDGSSKSLTALATWISSTTNATINGTGLATGVAAGSSIITATALGVSGSASLTITSRTLVSLAVTPASASVAAGLTQQFAAIGTYSDGSTNSLTASAVWSSSSATNATISSAGLAKGVATGGSIISATVSGVSGSATLTITPPALASLAVSPTSPSVAVGLTQQFTATGTYTDSSTTGLTASAVWISSNTTNATVNSAGLAKGVAAGTSTITATVSGVSGKATLTVSSAVFVLLTVTPSSVSVPTGMTQQFTATGTYSGGTTKNLTASVVWSSSATNAEVSSAGLAEALAPGNSTITATMTGISGAATLTTSGTNDVTADVELLGNPFSSNAPYARNIWSMIPYNGLLYFGYGNSSSLAPSPDAGPVSVVAFDPTNATFLTQCTVLDEQIDHYRVLGENLVIPGQKIMNANEGFGNYYVQEANGWTDFANIPQGTLTFDMYEYQGLWFAALGSYGTTILCSTNQGTNWSGALNPNLAVLGNTGQRVYSFFELNDTLYSMTLVLLPDYNLAPTLLRFDTNAGVFVTNSEAGPNALTAFCPDTSIPLGRDYYIARATNVNNGLLYILGAITNDTQWDPLGLYWATNVNEGAKVNLPTGTQPWDILQDTNGSAWVLESTPISGSSNYWVQVVGTQDFANWHELLRFQSSTFARSFALFNGDFYFGLGCETNTLSTATGNILRVKSEYFHPD